MSDQNNALQKHTCYVNMWTSCATSMHHEVTRMLLPESNLLEILDTFLSILPETCAYLQFVTLGQCCAFFNELLQPKTLLRPIIHPGVVSKMRKRAPIVFDLFSPMLARNVFFLNAYVYLARSPRHRSVFLMLYPPMRMWPHWFCK